MGESRDNFYNETRQTFFDMPETPEIIDGIIVTSNLFEAAQRVVEAMSPTEKLRVLEEFLQEGVELKFDNDNPDEEPLPLEERVDEVLVHTIADLLENEDEVREQQDRNMDYDPLILQKYRHAS